VVGGYNFTKNWRSTLPGVYATGMGAHNFIAAANKIVSYQTLFYSATRSSGSINFLPIGADAGFYYMSFSIIVIT
jgi:hypothetical protein